MTTLLPEPSIPTGFKLWGRVQEIATGLVKIGGVSAHASVGDEVQIVTGKDIVLGEILTVSSGAVTAQLYASESPLRLHDKAYISATGSARIGDHWLGEIVNYKGEVTGTQPSLQDGQDRPLKSAPLPAHQRRTLGQRLRTGLMGLDTLLPLCSGQRLGLFAGSGVGKSTLLGTLAAGVHADRVVIALIGERSREVNAFVTETLPPEVMRKCTVIAATASEPAGSKTRAAYCAMSAAEHFRDQGHSVLLLFDSLTRFAEAHRETALAAGEAPALNAFPPSTMRVIAELVERAGPGAGQKGDITALFSVLVAGSDMEEPVADMARGILDGHIILSRDIAERGRYPAIDVLRSVSRALPRAASAEENAMLSDYRRLVATYDEVLPMIRADLYQVGQDPHVDRAVRLFSDLDRFVGAPNTGSVGDAFDTLKAMLSDA